MKKKTKKVKAWVVIVFEDMISNARTCDGFGARAVFLERSEAVRFKKDYDARCSKSQGHNPRVIPVLITPLT